MLLGPQPPGQWLLILCCGARQLKAPARRAFRRQYPQGLADPKYLEDLTGLTALHEAGDAVLEAAWEDEDEEGGGSGSGGVGRGGGGGGEEDWTEL